MRLLAAASTELPAPAAEVFGYISDLRNFGDWFPGVLAIAATHADGTPGAGAAYLETVQLPLKRRRQVRIEVVEFAAGQRLVTESPWAPIWPRMQIEVRRLDDASCAVDWRMYSRSRSALVRTLLLPLVSRMMQARAQQAMRRLQQHFDPAGTDSSF